MTDKLQDEIHAWHLRNYPNDDMQSALLGIAEELGEVARAQLKQDGGIRGTWQEWQDEKFKEIGDVFIGLLNYAGFRGFSLATEVEESVSPAIANYTTAKGALLAAYTSFGLMLQCYQDPAAFYTDLVAYCGYNNFDPAEVLEKRWAVISKRDYIANPLTGGRESEV